MFRICKELLRLEYVTNCMLHIDIAPNFPCFLKDGSCQICPAFSKFVLRKAQKLIEISADPKMGLIPLRFDFKLQKVVLLADFRIGFIYFYFSCFPDLELLFFCLSFSVGLRR